MEVRCRIEQTKRKIQEKKQQLAQRMQKLRHRPRLDLCEVEADSCAGRTKCEESVAAYLKDTSDLSESLLTITLPTDPTSPSSPASPPCARLNRPSLPDTGKLRQNHYKKDASRALKLQVESQIRLIKEHLETTVSQRETVKAQFKRNLLLAFGCFPEKNEEKLTSNRPESMNGVYRRVKTDEGWRDEEEKRPSNRRLIRNAIKQVCCAGDEYRYHREAALSVIDSFPSVTNFILLLRPNSVHILGIYEYLPDSFSVKRLKSFSECPMEIRSKDVARYYRFDCGARQFRSMQCAGLSLATDAVTLRTD